MKGQENNKEFKIGNQILNETDLDISVTYKGELFIMKYPTPYEQASIQADIAQKLGGFPRSTHDPNHVALMEATVTVDHILDYSRSPKWFASAWTCYDEECIGALYRGYLRFRSEFQEKLRRGRSESSN